MFGDSHEWGDDVISGGCRTGRCQPGFGRCDGHEGRGMFARKILRLHSEVPVVVEQKGMVTLLGETGALVS